ncbi:prepilin-type N-terminal cleavage/methylation domain-containing protein [Janthinobacterium sp.]|uniref:prepilin-type N-terminal cleavage/methylation domain-containing protein n=1 Tax=Janthinobacterium sp. TaxID=1871054 RepID=UPI00293D83BD|nr:prepilin-type N-terminal cleavage/methylation domain-containing protein [Janthinobacterium sp.]
MSIKASTRRQRGISMIELIMFMVIIGIAVGGLTMVMSRSVAGSADPLARKQALLIAEALLEEVELAGFSYCDPSDAQAQTAGSAAVGPLDCQGTVENVGPDNGETRPYDNVNDYVSKFGVAQAAFNSAGVLASVNLSPLPTAGYTATLSITPETLGQIPSGAAPTAMEVLRITVTVNYANDSVVLDGYRTRYAPNAI